MSPQRNAQAGYRYQQTDCQVSHLPGIPFTDLEREKNVYAGGDPKSPRIETEAKTPGVARYTDGDGFEPERIQVPYHSYSENPDRIEWEEEIMSYAGVGVVGHRAKAAGRFDSVMNLVEANKLVRFRYASIKGFALGVPVTSQVERYRRDWSSSYAKFLGTQSPL